MLVLSGTEFDAEAEVRHPKPIRWMGLGRRALASVASAWDVEHRPRFQHPCFKETDYRRDPSLEFRDRFRWIGIRTSHEHPTRSTVDGEPLEQPTQCLEVSRHVAFYRCALVGGQLGRSNRLNTKYHFMLRQATMLFVWLKLRSLFPRNELRSRRNTAICGICASAIERMCIDMLVKRPLHEKTHVLCVVGRACILAMHLCVFAACSDYEVEAACHRVLLLGLAPHA